MSSILVTEAALATIRDAAARAHPRETGGILLGVHAPETPWVTLALEVPDENATRHGFHIRAGATVPLVDVARRADPRIGYLGEWHSHPQDVGSSSVDRRSLTQLARQISPAPVLLIIARRQATGQYAFDAQSRTRLRSRAHNIVATGPLPETEPNSDQ